MYIPQEHIDKPPRSHPSITIDVKLAPRNKESYKSICKNEFSSLKLGAFDAEFDSA
jgi:hypothetical protein